MLFAGLAAAESVKYELDGNTLQVPHPVVYDTGKASLKKQSGDAIAYVKGYLDAKSYISTLRIEVHTDSQGADDKNLKLSQARADSVVAYLVGKGVPQAMLSPVGYGETKPIADNKTAAGREQNRRVEFSITEMNGKPVEPAAK